MDSEFYDPTFLHAENSVLSTNHSTLNILGKFIPGPFGSAFLVSNYDPSSEYRYIRGKDVKPFILEDKDNVFLKESDYTRLSKYSVQPNDLMISVVGTLGNVAIVSTEKGIFSCKSTVLRDTNISAYYLLAYLNSEHGKKCLIRRQRGAVQTGLNIEDLQKVPVPLFTEKIRNQIADAVKKALLLKKRSVELFNESSLLLEKVLGLDTYIFNKTKYYTTSINKIFGNNRCDAEYYQPAYDKVWQLLAKYESKSLNSLCSYIGYGTVPTSPYTIEGVPYVKGLNLKDTFIEGNIDYLDRNSTRTLPAKYFLKPMDIVISQMGSVGYTGLVLPEQDGYLYASFTIMARLSNYELVDPYYLSLYINNIARPYYIMRKIAQASVRQNTDLPTLRKLPVVLIGKDKQLEIADLLHNYKKTKTESEMLLKTAIEQIDNLIEPKVSNETH